MKRLLVPLAVLVLAAACDSGPRVVVRASLEPGGPVSDLPVLLLPYDRQAVLDSLRRAADKPEPTLPQEVIQRLRGDTSTVPPPAADTGARRDTAAARRRDSTMAVIRAMTRPQLRRYADSVRRAQRAWADSAYASFDEVVRAKVDAAARGEQTDTTAADGVARFAPKDGDWWVWARYTLPNEEVEWLVPVRVPEKGDSIVVTLNRANGKSHPTF